MPKNNYHIHTSFSDGRLNVADTVDFLKNHSVKRFSITDHDEIVGNYQAKALADSFGMKYINGIELSCCFNGEEGLNPANICHILGYNFDLSLMEKELKILSELKKSAMIRLGRQLNKDGYDIMLTSSRFLYAESLYKFGYASSIVEAFYNILNDSRYLNISRNLPFIDDGIEIIKRCGGIAVWAHPYEIVNGKKQKLSFDMVEKLAKIFKSYALDGLETYYSYFSNQDIINLVSLAKKFDYLKTVGTDFHGKAGRNTAVRSLAYFDNDIIKVEENLSSIVDSFYI